MSNVQFTEDLRVSAIAGYDADTAMVNGNGNHEHSDEAEAKQDGTDETDGGEESSDQEVIVIQDTGFTVKIQAPGTEPFDLQVKIASVPRVELDPETAVRWRVSHLSRDLFPGVSPGNGPGDSPGADGPRGHLPPHLLLTAAGRKRAGQLRRAQVH